MLPRAHDANVKLKAEAAKGHMLVQPVVKSELLKQHFPWVACTSCGALATKRLGGLISPCQTPGVHGKRAIRALEQGFCLPGLGTVKVPAEQLELRC